MMSSSEVQRITLSTAKIVSPTGFIDLEDWTHTDRDDDDTGPETEEPVTPADDTPPAAAESTTAAKEKPIDFTTPLSVAVNAVNGIGGGGDGLTNGTSSGDEASPNKANETITSSIGDITIDSVRDHLNSTTTTLCSTTTEEIVGMCLGFTVRIQF